MRYSKELLNEKYKELPENIKDAMGSLEVADAVQEIADKYQLHIDIAGLLNEEITYVMTGVVSANDFVKNLKTHLDLPEEKAQKIAYDVDEKIFSQIRESLKSLKKEPEFEQVKEQKEIIQPSSLQQPFRSKAPVIQERREFKEPKEIKEDEQMKQFQKAIYHPVLKEKEREISQSEQTYVRPGKREEYSSIVKKEEKPSISTKTEQDLGRKEVFGLKKFNVMPSREEVENKNNIFNKKLTGQVRIPKEEINISAEEGVNPPSAYSGGGGEKKKPYSVDPYREPIE